MKYCFECREDLSDKVFQFSTQQIGIPLCIKHQDWLDKLLYNTSVTYEALELYFALRERDVPAKIEKNDGYKTIDIAVPAAKVNIEIDGGHHNYSHKQALSDLKRTYHSFKKGYLTLRIPNSLIRNHLEETADHITEFLNVNVKRISKSKFTFKGKSR